MLSSSTIASSSSSVPIALVLYRGPIEVDWNIGPVSQALRPSASLLLIERSIIAVATPEPLTPAERRAEADQWLAFFWAMAPIAIKYCGRRDIGRAVKQIDLLTTAFIALWRLVREPAGPNPLLAGGNRRLEPELEVQIPQFGESIDLPGVLGIMDELCRQVQALYPVLTDLGVSVPTEVEAEAAILWTVAAEIVGRGDGP